MALSTGMRLGPYEILATLGTGGMGEVYQARDTRLERIVALKVLPSSLSSDTESKQRFEREARTISSLSHPHICALHDVGHQDGIDFLVMEFLEGDTLAARLTKGPLSVDQVLRYGMEIADALDNAHRKGIIHRDLKPANIMLTTAGTKLLDFGLAKLSKPENQRSILDLPTRQHHLTAKGNILGTIQYMSPEQLEGKEVDSRTDIFSFGAVVYEMATGNKAFNGNSPASIISAILNSEPPPISSVRPVIPEALDRIVQTCLAKNHADRWQTARDVALQLRWMTEGSLPAGISATARRLAKKKISVSWILAAFFSIATLVLAAVLYQLIRQTPTQSPSQIRRLSMVMSEPENSTVYSMAISPDGQRLAYVATERSGIRTIWLRSLDSTVSEQIQGTDEAVWPFWSPDSRSLAFFTQRELKRLTLGGGPPETLCEVDIPKGGTWNQEGVILFAQTNVSGLYRISAAGGEPTPVTTLDHSLGEAAHRFPTFLPDGRHFFYVVISRQRDHHGLYLGSLDSKEKKRLLPDDQKVEYVDPGYGLFVRNSKLMVQPFDVTRLEFTGKPRPVADNVEAEHGWGTGLFSVSEDNALVYRDGKGWANQPVWFDRSGKQTETIGEPGHYYSFSDLSLDGKKLLTSFDGGLWIIDPMKSLFSRFALTNDTFTIFSPDGSHVAYVEETEDGYNLYQRLSSGTGKAELLYHSKNPAGGDLSWSTDGRFILFSTYDLRTNQDEWVLPLFGERKPFPYLQTESREENAQFSPDGKWIAYVSDESGTPEVYVRSFPVEAAGKWQISTVGAQQPRWRRDGKELYYLTLDKNLWAMEVKTGETFETGTSTFLFRTRAEPILYARSDTRQYFAAADGQHFLMNTLTESTTPIEISVMLNWKSLLKK